MAILVGDGLGDGSDGSEDDIETWMRKRAADVTRLTAPETDAANREAWNASTRSGANLAARTPGELRRLSTSGRPAAPPSATGASTAADVVERLRAGARGAADALLIGHEDDAEAALGTLPALFSGEALGPQYHAALQRARAQDSYDEAHYPLSRGVGEVLGTGAALLATDGMAAAAAPKFAAGAYSAARAIPALTWAGRAKLAAGGAGLGLIGQGYSDVMSGRTSDWRDYGASAIGGAVGVSSALKVRPAYAAGLGAVARDLADAALNRASPNIDQMARDTTAAGYLGGSGQAIGEGQSHALDWRTKGKLGERLSDARLSLDGEKVVARQKGVRLTQGRSTRPDFILEPDPVTGAPRYNDAKFGPTARPTPSQLLAEQIHPGSYQYHYWMPSHVGQIAGSTLASLGVPMLDRSADQAPPPW